MSELRLEYIALSKLNEWKRNPKLHALDAIVESFNRRGFRDAVILDEAIGENTIIAGNGRLEALRAMKKAGQPAPEGIRVEGDEWLVPVQVGMNSKDAAEAAAWGLDHNSISMMGGDFTPFDLAKMWDETEYRAMLTELAQSAALPISVSGDDLDSLILAENPKEETADVGEIIDKAAELQEKWQVRRGGLWVAGRHRILCGDSTNAEDVARLMGGEKCGAVVTDSPYGIDREGIANDDPEGLRKLFDGCLAVMPIDNAVIINFQSPRLFPVWLDAIRAAGHKFERMLWMYKPNDETFPWRGWLQTSEAIVISSKGNGKWNRVDPFAHDCYSPTTIGSELEKDWGKVHASVKPLSVVQDLIGRIGGDVYEPFCGSGTTPVACEKLGRKCFAVELTPNHVAVSLERLSLLGLECKRIE